ncbi:hypothetical protein MMC31_003285 [Peltigera leucophlebia]|nr:hypothetical protein [Peltigera leucophlebia]
MATLADRDVLPQIVKPIHYDLSIYELELGGGFTFQGTVKIQVEIKEPTREITLNAIDIKVHEANVSLSEYGPSGPRINASNITYDTFKQRVTLRFPQEIPHISKTSEHAAFLTLKYEGVMNNQMAGFYRSRYKPVVAPAASVPQVGEYHYMFSTQFESGDARRAFPCFDEPNLKATFDISIELPEDQVALSNMDEKEVGKGKEGRKVVKFERTPIMSTYLVAWAVGDFEYVEDFTNRNYNGKQLPVRVYTTKGLKEQGRFGLENAHQIVDYFSEVIPLALLTYFHANWLV